LPSHSFCISMKSSNPVGVCSIWAHNASSELVKCTNSVALQMICVLGGISEKSTRSEYFETFLFAIQSAFLNYRSQVTRMRRSNERQTCIGR
jgi:hypothetical protein